MSTRTSTRSKILQAVTDEGPLTVRQVCAKVGLESPSSAHRHLKVLEEKGLIQYVHGYVRK